LIYRPKDGKAFFHEGTVLMPNSLGGGANAIAFANAARKAGWYLSTKGATGNSGPGLAGLLAET